MNYFLERLFTDRCRKIKRRRYTGNGGNDADSGSDADDADDDNDDDDDDSDDDDGGEVCPPGG